MKYSSYGLRNLEEPDGQFEANYDFRLMQELKGAYYITGNNIIRWVRLLCYKKHLILNSSGGHETELCLRLK